MILHNLMNVLRTSRGRGTFLLSLSLLISANLYAESYFGFAPLDPDPELTTAQGSGKNGFAEAAITLDPVSNGVVRALKGSRIIGVRCFMRADYPQKSKRTSSVNVRVGSLDAEPVKNYVNLFQGWNEVMLEEPVVIGDEPIFIGPMVYETSGNPYPFVSATGGALPGGYSVSLNLEEWQTPTQRGNLLCYAILDTDPADMPLAAAAAPFNIPSVVAPQNVFSCDATIHNFSSEPLTSAEIMTSSYLDFESFAYQLTLDPPIPPFDSRNVEVLMSTGTSEDAEAPYSLEVSAVNGKTPVSSPSTKFTLHVTHNAYLRIPLVEEFTSQQCVNCPFMAYYLDMAIEEFNRPLVYVGRHTGFVNDLFTLPNEKELLYLFGNSGTYNPAVMYDRTVRSESDLTPVYGASLPSMEPYITAIEEMANRPAMAKILVESVTSDGKVSCVVKGKLSDSAPTDGLYLSAMLIENKIAPIPPYFQMGLDDAPADAPADLKEKFMHNGVARINFNKEALGDPLTVNPETLEFTVDFGSADFNPAWNADNCEVVAFISRVNKDDLRDNYVLNAGGTRWNKEVENSSGSGITISDADSPRLNVYATPDHMIAVEGDYTAYSIFGLDGRRYSTANPLPRGIYVVSVATEGGRRSFKLKI